MNNRHCLGCERPLPEPFLDLGSTPLANSYVSSDLAHLPDPVFPLAVAFCSHCYLVQLTDVIPPEELFSDYSYFSSYSESYLAHASRMADSLRHRFSLDGQSKVLEVASNDGYLLQYFLKAGVPARGVEPAANIARCAVERGIPTYVRFFDQEAVRIIHESFGAPDLIIGNNVLAHVPQVNTFLRAVAECLGANGCAVFEFPHVLQLLRHVEFDTIYHEHVFYYSLLAIRLLAERAGLHLFDVEQQSVHGGSLRVFLQRGTSRPVSPAVDELLRSEQAAGLADAATYLAFREQVRNLRHQLLDLLHGLKAKGKRLAAYGAPAKGNTLLNYCGIADDLLEFTVDCSPYKQNRLLPGSRLMVLPPEALLKRMPDYTLLLPWNLADEIVQQQHAYLSAGGSFIVPVPQPRLLRAEEPAMAASFAFASGTAR